MEQWRDVPSLPTHEVSNLGRIRSKPHAVPMPRGGMVIRSGAPHAGILRDGRPSLFYRGKNYRISRLICEAFHGPAPFQKAVAMHLDDNPANNVPGNLRWGTQKENLNTPKFLAYCRSRTGVNNPYLKGLAN